MHREDIVDEVIFCQSALYAEYRRSHRQAQCAVMCQCPCDRQVVLCLRRAKRGQRRRGEPRQAGTVRA